MTKYYSKDSRDSLKYNVCSAIETWKSTSWSELYSKEVFRDYVLPPNIAFEPLEFYWREDIPKWLHYKDTSDVLVSAQRINRKVDIVTDFEAWGNPPLGYTETMEGNVGKCDDRAILTAMAMRSYGIPAAYEFIPCWGSRNNGHSFCSVILPDLKLAVFQDKFDSGLTEYFSHKVPKIYRFYSYGGVNSLDKYAYQTRYLEDTHAIDVTDQHNISQIEEVSLPLYNDSNSSVYLSVYSNKTWMPVAKESLRKKTRVTFKHIGTGKNISNGDISLGENIGDGILYLPITYQGNSCLPVSSPVIVSEDGIRAIKPSSVKERIIISRKYPRLQRIVGFANNMKGGYFEMGSDEGITTVRWQYKIVDTPNSYVETIPVKYNTPVKWIRFRKPRGAFSIADLHVFNQDGKEIEGQIISDKALEGLSELENVFDDDVLSFFELPVSYDLWVGIRFKEPTIVGSFDYCPRTDFNDITPGHSYDIYYWDDRWIMLGNHIAENNYLEVDIPKGALILVDDVTAGKEIRPFTFEDGRQIWW